MTEDLQERLRRSLATHAEDVRTDPAAWERVQERIRRRAWARWSAVGVSAAAALVLAILVLPGLLTATRVDLGPADPGAAGTTTLVTTDGRAIEVADPGGEVIRQLAVFQEDIERLPISRLAVRPGSTPDDLTVVYLRADAACERVEIGWVRDTTPGTESVITEGTLGGGQGFCATGPVWSPGGDTVAWVETAPEEDGGAFALHLRRWEGDEPADEASAHPLDQFATSDLVALRATDWWWEPSAGAGADGFISLSGSTTGGAVRAYVLPVEHLDDAVGPGTLLEPVDPAPDEEIRSAVLVASSPVTAAGKFAGYELGVAPDGTVSLSRLADDAPPTRLSTDVLAADDIDRGDAWLSARGDIAVVGARGRSWVFTWEGGDVGGKALPGVVHAAVMAAPPTADPEPPQPAPAGLSYAATDGERLTVIGPAGRSVIATAEHGAITDFVVRPGSTPDDLTVVWREGTGCDATLRHLNLVGVEDPVTGTVTAECPGRPAFAPDGGHVAWVSAAAEATDGFLLETLAWDDGPGDSVVTFGLSANPAEIVELTLLDWVWTDTASAGHLHLAGTDSHGTVSALTAPIERQGDGALALPAGAVAEQVTPFEVDQDRLAVLRVDSHHSVGAAVGPDYTLEQTFTAGGEDELAVVRGGDGDQRDRYGLLPDLLRVNTTGEVDEVWMTARGDEVFLGNGAGRAWRLRWAGEGWRQLEELDPQVRYAVPLVDVPVPSRTPAAGPAAPEAPQPDALPAAVAATRALILQAARAGDVAALAALTGDGFTSSYGAPEEPESFFTRLRDEGELDRLVRVLELPHGEDDGLYSWPFAHTRSMDSLSSAERGLLATVATVGEIDRWIEFGSGYLGWRAGIEADGTWRFYVAGD